jgi:hypothetical protein
MTVIIGLGLYTVVIALNLFFRRETVRFLAKHAAITDLASLEAFKNLARRNMKAVFPLTAAFLVAMALSAFLIIDDPLVGFVTFLLANGLVAWSALALRKVEIRARELPCPDPALAAAYKRISTSWLSDPWPDF